MEYGVVIVERLTQPLRPAKPLHQLGRNTVQRSHGLLSCRIRDDRTRLPTGDLLPPDRHRAVPEQAMLTVDQRQILHRRDPHLSAQSSQRMPVLGFHNQLLPNWVTPTR